MTKYIYHVCAFFFYPNGDKLYWDGVATLDNEIISLVEYHELKSIVVQLTDMDEATKDNLIITNLALLKVQNIDTNTNLKQNDGGFFNSAVEKKGVHK